jgi:hypothetical protein
MSYHVLSDVEKAGDFGSLVHLIPEVAEHLPVSQGLLGLASTATHHDLGSSSSAPNSREGSNLADNSKQENSDAHAHF